ncbi:(2Fe-2S)-binding protein [Oceanidesulfovibrio marinus]|uniref:(2Fe-2S)-binding protein n=1 Tax=Oceanidesulfovibrio marinus TaxID=370038 RepID=A0ABX6NDL3_9BACT|nr:(2Fe-2S)-binding protein [Oceanidesulfovibrio marinus]QJT08686.1 (2Fe-2S)-binding protein [Oceanidesulfovibrio marinus]
MHSEGCNCQGRKAHADDDLVLCRCEEVTKGEIRDALAAGITTVSGVKRATRAGMGLCQGQTCGRLVAGMVAREADGPVDPATMEPVTARPPVRPTPMGVLANDSQGGEEER